MATLKNTTISDNSFLKLPTGTSPERPGSPTVGDSRFNTTLNLFETWNGSSWVAAIKTKQPEFTVVSFTDPGSYTFTVPVGVEFVHVLVVAGGGGGAQRHGGGGGAGGMLEQYYFPVAPGGSVPVVVGGAGPSVNGPNPFGNPGLKGSPSSFSYLSVEGGGGGYSDGSQAPVQDGGSGGGGSHNPGNTSGAGRTGLGTSQYGQGYPGGGASNSPAPVGGTGPYPGSNNPHSGGGGGGAGGAGQPSPDNSHAGAGGMGRQSWITGEGRWYAGGGGGGNHSGHTLGGNGGLGGGGRGGGHATAGVPGTGGGGGCFSNNNPYGQPGGDGIVIVRWTEANRNRAAT
jgi:hypothetical protein